MNYVRRINIVFLCTIITIFMSNLIPFGSLVTNESGLLLISQAIIAGPSILFLIFESIKIRKTSVGMGLDDPYHIAYGYNDLEDRRSIKEQLCFHKISFSTVLWLILFTICVTPAINFINAISRMFSVATINNTMVNITEKNSYLVALFCVAIVPCIMEEIVYRGIFYQGYRRVHPLGAAFLSAFLFGILHGNLNQFCYAFVMGIIFAFIIEATDSIISTMIIHFMMNGWSITLLYAIPKLFEYLKNMAAQAAARGDHELASMITNYLGTDSLDFNQILQDSASTVLSDMSFFDIVSTYGVSALLGGILAFFIFRKIAKNTGRYEYIKNLFTGRNPQGDGISYDYQEKRKVNPSAMFTFPLWIAIAICVFNLVMNEVYIQSML